MEVSVRAQAQGGKNSCWSCIIKILLSGAWRSPINPHRGSRRPRHTLHLLCRRGAGWLAGGSRPALGRARVAGWARRRAQSGPGPGLPRAASLPPSSLCPGGLCVLPPPPQRPWAGTKARLSGFQFSSSTLALRHSSPGLEGSASELPAEATRGPAVPSRWGQASPEQSHSVHRGGSTQDPCCCVASLPREPQPLSLPSAIPPLWPCASTLCVGQSSLPSGLVTVSPGPGLSLMSWLGDEWPLPRRSCPESHDLKKKKKSGHSGLHLKSQFSGG